MINPLADLITPEPGTPRVNFSWAIVTQVNPLRIRWDGESAALPIDPDTIVYADDLQVGDRVLGLHLSRQTIIMGQDGGKDFNPDTEKLYGDLEAAYLTGGLAKVWINGTLLGPFPWLSEYRPQGLRRVKVLRDGTNYEILGQTNEDVVPLNLGPAWSTYSITQVSLRYDDSPRATKLSTGAVLLSGLIAKTSGVSDGDVIATLPVGFRPEFETVLPLLVESSQRSITIKPNGDITASAGWGPTWASLNGLVFLAADPSRVWTPITAWGAGFGAFNTSQFGVPGWWTDSCGFTWFRGRFIINSGSPVDNTLIATIPSAAGSYNNLGQHIVSAAGTYNARLGVTNTSILFKSGTPTAVGSVISLENLMVASPASRTKNKWTAITSWANGWRNYDGNWPQAQFCMREDGMRLLVGLVAAGSQGYRMTKLIRPEYYTDHGDQIYLTCSDAVLQCRIDLMSQLSGADAATVVPRGGSSGWMSLDNIRWVP